MAEFYHKTWHAPFQWLRLRDMPENHNHALVADRFARDDTGGDRESSNEKFATTRKTSAMGCGCVK